MCGGLLHNQEMLRITRKNPVTLETMHLVLAVEYIVYARLYSFWLLLFFLFFLGGFFHFVFIQESWILASSTFRIILHNTFKIII